MWMGVKNFCGCERGGKIELLSLVSVEVQSYRQLLPRREIGA
jgi:hypothetical protein